MKRQSPPKAAANVSLFPFLAVLLCAMGGLIVLLVAIARNSQNQAALASAVAARQSHAEALAARETLAWRIQKIRASREATAAQLAEARTELSHLEDHARRLAAEAEAAERALADGEKSATAELQNVDQLRRQVDDAVVLVKQAEQDLARAAADKRQMPESYAIIPFEGPHQTRRRPIYLECQADAILLQPEGIKFVEADFEGELGPNNPLAVALRATREHLVSTRAVNPDNAGEPYPLLLVRPDGIGAYYAARSAMSSWGTDFGYEFIDQDWKLAFKSADSTLADKVNRAVVDARRHQAELALVAPRLAPLERKATFRPSPNGGLERERGGTGSSRGAYAVGRPGGRGNGGPVGTGRGYSSHVAEANNNGLGGTGGSAAGQGGSSGWGDSPHGGGYGSGFTPGSNAPGGSSAYGGGVTTIGSARDPYSGSASPGGNGGPPGPNPYVVAGEALANQGTYATSNPLGGGTPGGPAGAGGSAGGSASGATSGSPSSGSSADASGKAAPIGTRSTPGAGPSGEPSKTPFETEGRAFAQSGTPNAGASTAGTPSTAGSRSFTVDMGAARGSPAAGGGNGGGGGPGGNGSPPDAGMSGGMPSPSFQFNQGQHNSQSEKDKQAAKRRESLAKARGHNWGLPNSSQSAVPLARPIQLECYADRLVLRAERGDKLHTNKTILLSEHTVDSVDELVSRIWEHIDGWGIAGRGMYWRPILSMHVAADGNQRFADLQAILADSGLEIRGKPLAP